MVAHPDEPEIDFDAVAATLPVESPEQAADAVRLVGARWALPVHHGTFWPIGLRLVHRANHHRLFVTPGPRFADALASAAPEAHALPPEHGLRVVLDEEDPS